MNDLCRIVYTSRNAIAVSGARALVHFNDIVSTARRNNARLGLCGFLLFDRRRFYQVLEGDCQKIDGLMDSIRRDRRHTDIDVLLREPISRRAFSEWSMASFLDEGDGALAQAHGLPGPKDPPLTAGAFVAFAESYLGVEPGGGGDRRGRGSADRP
jgi:hypothetical protein